ncbi:MAG: DUF3108 domain-containing protein [Candidatus Tectomicrobia bacterium]|nr:DUF3108 domain-containing protein [Candidatus Tectomicrobia bacterium]
MSFSSASNMNICKTLILFLFALLFFPPFSSSNPSHLTIPESPASLLPFDEGEELTFELKWLGIRAGIAKLHVKGRKSYNGREVFHLTSQADSIGWVSTFYKVRDRVESFLDAEHLYSHYFSLDQEEGSYRGRKQIFFDQTTHRAIYIKNQRVPQEFPIPSQVLDSLSILYALRTLSLQVGTPVYLEAFDKGKSWKITVQILRKEDLELYSGEVIKTILVKPLMPFEGVFKRKGDLYIWLSDDQKKLPVKMESETTIGSILATLIDARGHGGS